MSEKKDRFAGIKEKLDPVFEKIGGLTRVQRLLICLLTFAVIGGIYYYLIYAPKHVELKKVQTQYQAQKKKLDNYKREAAVLLEFEQKMADIQEEFNQAMRALPDKRELPSLLTGISRSGSDAGLAFILFKPEMESNQTFFKEIPVSIKVEGRYHQITDFFFQIERLNRIVNINDVEVKSQKNSQNLEMSCKAVTYMFIEQDKEAPAANKRDRNKKKKK
jgi:type IV pilus assembly protein PilO